jgi:hypothetical protein
MGLHSSDGLLVIHNNDGGADASSPVGARQDNIQTYISLEIQSKSDLDTHFIKHHRDI